MSNGARDWVVEKLGTHTEVASVKAIGDQVIEISRKKYPSVSAAVLSADRVTDEDIKQVLSTSNSLHFVMNLPARGVWTGAAIDVVRMRGLGWGGYGDLMSALGHDTVLGFQKKEFDFVERGLKQHDRVNSLYRRYDRVFEVGREKLPNITIALVNEYELTAEHVRLARDTYGNFDLLLKTNPNGKTTDTARRVAEDLNIPIVMWRELLSRLRR